MKIAIDLSASISGGGLLVASQLLKYIEKYKNEHFYVIFINSSTYKQFEKHPNINFIQLKKRYGLISEIFNQIKIKRLLVTEKCEVFFCPNNYCIQHNRKIKKVFMIQDSNIFNFHKPIVETRNKVRYFILYLLYRISLKNTNEVIFNNKYLHKQGKTIYLGVDHIKKCKVNNKKYDICTIISNEERYKNVELIFNALKMSKINLSMIIIGEIKKESNVAIISNMNAKVETIGNLNYEEIAEIISHSRLFVSTSLWESFSFPPFEAIINEIPILLSDIEIYRELWGDFPIYFDPYSPESLAVKIEDVFKNYDKYGKISFELKRLTTQLTWKNFGDNLFSILEKEKEENDDN